MNNRSPSLWITFFACRLSVTLFKYPCKWLNGGLLIVHHSQFGGTAQLAQAAEDGARSVGGIEVVSRRANEAGVDDVLAAFGVPVGGASPAGTAYEADVTKGSNELKVSLDDQFKVLQVDTEVAD